ncbi:hypothetical protein M758_3G043300 [Ceratodon purpureus]|nr:hypothetical protein M758_3G043300 [Ceratodon purpureus]
MAKRLYEGRSRWRSSLILVIVVCTCVVAYLCISAILPNSAVPSSQALEAHVAQSSVAEVGTGCFRGLEHTEFWGDAVNWGSDFLVDSSQACSDACKAKRKCNSWVYCGNQERCGANYHQCWLKRQKDPLDPEIHDSGLSNPWTSGLVFDKDIGTVELAIDSGPMSGEVIHMKLLPECSPQSVLRILQLAKLTHCSGCRIYRAEGRGKMWDSNGSPISKMGTGPPYAVLQGTLEAQHVSFKRVSKEYAPAIRRGMVGWVDGGPDFFISLADHPEWPRKHTVFATVVKDDMPLLESLAELPTTTATWEKVTVEVLDKPVSVKVQTAKKQ